MVICPYCKTVVQLGKIGIANFKQHKSSKACNENKLKNAEAACIKKTCKNAKKWFAPHPKATTIPGPTASTAQLLLKSAPGIEMSWREVTELTNLPAAHQVHRTNRVAPSTAKQPCQENVSGAKEVKSRSGTHEMLALMNDTLDLNSHEAEVALVEVSGRGQCHRVPKRKFIGKCICRNPVPAEEMENEGRAINCK